MPTVTEPYVIVVGIDFSLLSGLVLERAFDIAEDHSGAEIHVITVATGSRDELELDGNRAGRKLTVETASTELREYVEEALERPRDDARGNVEHVVTHLGIGNATAEIAQLADELEADLVVVGTHGRRGLRRLVLGSVAEAVLRAAHAPVLVVRPKDYPDESAAPEIEAPCPRCEQVRAQTAGTALWCEQHSQMHGPRHTYSVGRSRTSHNSGFLIPPFRH